MFWNKATWLKGIKNTGGYCIILLSIIIWLPITMYTVGLLVSDNILEFIKDD